MEARGKDFFAAEAAAYVEECRRNGSAVRASELASRMRRTPAQLAREFHIAVGERLKDYLTILQVEHAKELLCNSSRGTAEIAVACGFGTARSFYRAFRRITGIGPTQYRRTPPACRDIDK
jgi:transcriptional regulator GlxA family with amidase domain